MKHLLSQSHMKVCYGAQPRLLSTGLNPMISTKKDERAEETLLEGIDEAAYLGLKG